MVCDPMGDPLRTEAIVFGKYLVDRVPAEALIDRYCRANEELFAAAADDPADPDVAFAREHPWAIAMLDAAAGLRGGESLLRKKLLVMTAIVETTPEYVERTEPRAVGLTRLAWKLGVSGARTAFHTVTGLALTAALRRRRG